jgi:hypothetical protein
LIAASKINDGFHLYDLKNEEISYLKLRFCDRIIYIFMRSLFGWFWNFTPSWRLFDDVFNYRQQYVRRLGQINFVGVNGHSQGADSGGTSGANLCRHTEESRVRNLFPHYKGRCRRFPAPVVLARLPRSSVWRSEYKAPPLHLM